MFHPRTPQAMSLGGTTSNGSRVEREGGSDCSDPPSPLFTNCLEGAFSEVPNDDDKLWILTSAVINPNSTSVPISRTFPNLPGDSLDTEEGGEEIWVEVYARNRTTAGGGLKQEKRAGPYRPRMSSAFLEYRARAS